MQRLLEENENIQVIWELSPAQLEDAGSSAEELLTWLDALGFSFTIIDDASGEVQRSSIEEVLNSCPCDSFLNILCDRNG